MSFSYVCFLVMTRSRSQHSRVFFSLLIPKLVIGLVLSELAIIGKRIYEIPRNVYIGVHVFYTNCFLLQLFAVQLIACLCLTASFVFSGKSMSVLAIRMWSLFPL
jgi:hypothetical protein